VVKVKMHTLERSGICWSLRVLPALTKAEAGKDGFRASLRSKKGGTSLRREVTFTLLAAL